jgi:hypothetical protein
MLKISVSETTTEERWTLCGRLTAPWVRELSASWKKNHRAIEGRTCVIDLNEVSFIDKSGERCLRTMMKQGAEFVARGVYVKHVLEHLNGKKKHGPSDLFIGLFACLLIPHVAAGTRLSRRTAASAPIETQSQFSQSAQQTLVHSRTQVYFDGIRVGENNVH